MTLDDADAIQRFISQIKGQREPSTLTALTTPSSTQHEQVANGHASTVNATDGNNGDMYSKFQGVQTPHATARSQEHHLLTFTEALTSPRMTGLVAPQNTPKTATSSPRLAADNTHNEDVAEAFSDYVNSMNGRPLSDSMWAPASTRHKPSMLGGAHSTKVLTPIKAVEPNPAINDTFNRMSFKAADPDHKVDENPTEDRVKQVLFSKTSNPFDNKFSVLADKNHEDKRDDVQQKLEAAADKNHEDKRDDKVQVETEGASDENLQKFARTDYVGKEDNAPSTSKAYLPPHLRVTRGSIEKTRSSIEKLVKPETSPPCTEGRSLVVTSKIAGTGSVKDVNDPAVRAHTNFTEHKAATSPAGAKTLTDPLPEDEDLEHQTVFSAWPKQEERSRPAAKTRKVIIKDLPHGSTATFVASLVYGGPVEEIHIRSSAAGDLSAVIRFMDAEDCMRFYNETSNGLVYKKDAKERELVLFVELSKDVDVVGGLLQNWIVSGVTRCVRAVGVETDWGMDGLRKIAERKNRKVEKIVDGQNPGGARSVVFRFCKVEDAVQFRAALSRDEEWEHCNIHYAADPCAAATGVHLEN
ncbi:hypothetical protein IMSHALPRED_009056 [Imshaugia aleurites]|uniref:RRM domain-containing protein n=1 Tax=Imshaugia aleurites TaxID=172621 RepID=A0A8H3FY86_9LECA|nr:hypothetical protein IMSHALPRED_009056 [Imshaugia aleurites]